MAPLVHPLISVGVALTKDAERIRALCGHLGKGLSRATGFGVRCVGLPSYDELLEAMEKGDVDIAWLPPLLALRAAVRARMVPIAIPVREGVAWFSTALFTRSDSPIATLSDVRGARGAWVDRHSAGGYVVIRASLRARGVSLGEAFASDTFYGTHEAVTRAVLAGEADVGATFVHLADDAGAIRRAGWGQAAMRVLALEGPIPSDVLAASVLLPAAHAREIQRALIAGEDEELCVTLHALLDAERFVLPEPQHLDRLGALIAGLEGVGR